MKVVHVIASDSGGAARAALRINHALQSIGVESSALVLKKTKYNPDVLSIFNNNMSWSFFRLLRKVNEKNVKTHHLSGLFYEAYFGIDISNLKVVKEADVVNLHWINDGMLSNKTLRTLLKSGKKVVWTMHDMYAFTAGCYYDSNCGEIKNKCKNCPLANDNTKAEDFIRHQYSQKEKCYRDQKITLVGCSNWMASKAKESPLTERMIIASIQNPIDTRAFKPIFEEKLFSDLTLDHNKKTILFGAMSADSDDRKGYKYLKKALAFLDKDKFQAVVFGNSGKLDDSISGIKVRSVGRITSDESLAKLYSLADVFIAPSIQENLSNAVMESLACGTPVVAFDIGGMPDMIIHQQNGYLAKPFEAEDLAEGIRYCASKSLGDKCTEIVTKRFSMNVIGMKYLKLYKDI